MISTAHLPSVILKNLDFSYRLSHRESCPALHSLTFAIPAQCRFVALIGPDGAGKSTLMQLLCGLLRPTNGSVRVLGVEPDADDESFVSHVGFMPQSLGLYMDLSCWENLELFARLRNAVADSDPAALADRIHRMLVLTGLTGFEHCLAGQLSGGMKQKLALASALIKTPDLLLLDEPTVGVDPLSRRQLWSVVKRMIATTSMRVVFSTGYIEEAEQAEWVLFLENGRLLACGTPQQIKEKAKNRCFRLTLPENKKGKSLSRSLMLEVRAQKAGSYLVDAVPRGSCMDLVTEPGTTKQDVEALVKAGETNEVTVAVRPACLQDAYAVVTFDRLRKPQRQGCSTFVPNSALETHGEMISARGIRRVFGSFVAVADTSFSVRKGEIFGLLGPNGAGKTTTFRMLCGLLAPSSGRVEVAGCNMSNTKSLARSRIGYVAQKFSLYAKLSAIQNLRYFARSYGLFGQGLTRRVEELLQEFFLKEKQNIPAAELSLGAKRDLAVACALVHHPEILFLDEATSGADLASRRAFWRRIVSLSRQGTTVVVTTHFMEEAEYCDRFLIQDAGTVLALGTPQQVREMALSLGAQPQDPQVGLSVEEAFLAIVQEHRKKMTQGGRI